MKEVNMSWTPEDPMAPCPNPMCVSHEMMGQGDESFRPVMEKIGDGKVKPMVVYYHGRCPHCGVSGPLSDTPEDGQRMWDVCFMKPMVVVTPNRLCEHFEDAKATPGMNRLLILQDPTKGQSREELSKCFVVTDNDGVSHRIDSPLAYGGCQALCGKLIDEDELGNASLGVVDCPECLKLLKQEVEHKVKIRLVDAEGNLKPSKADDWWCGKCEVGFSYVEALSSGSMFFQLGTPNEYPGCPICGHVLVMVAVCDSCKAREAEPTAEDITRDAVGAHTSRCSGLGCQPTTDPSKAKDTKPDAGGVELEDTYDVGFELNTERFSDDPEVVKRDLEDLADTFGVTPQKMGKVIQGIADDIDKAVIDPDKEGE